ncbi:hypothetical protein Y5W_01037 [Alcanivorax sp. 521-1]|uniref:Uncharacterized protein n=1 Tax=Alloalcanivorax profundimaris TaxID=2735259 RepID=A0ABS0ANM8_9GAMM|nr:hypothetical protein [Alloalcanivorax profundimaris]
MSDGEFDPVTIDHFQSFTLRVHAIGIQHGTTPENGMIHSPLSRANDQFRLEYPCHVTVGIRFLLGIYQEQGHQAIPIGILRAHRALNPDLGMLAIRSTMRDGAVDQGKGQLAATRNTLPDFDFLPIRFDQVMFIIGQTFITPPASFYLDAISLTIDTEGHTQATRNQGLITGGVDLVTRIRLRLDTSGRPPKLCTRLVLPWCLGVDGFFRCLIGHGSFKPFESASFRIPGGQFADQIAIPNTHVDDTLMGATSRTEQVIHDRQL